MSDFTAVAEVGGTFVAVAVSGVVSFSPTGDGGLIEIVGLGFGEGGFGELGFSSGTTIILSGGITTWTNIETP